MPKTFERARPTGRKRFIGHALIILAVTLAAIPAAFSALPGIPAQSVALSASATASSVSRVYYLVPSKLASGLSPAAVVLHEYDNRLLVSVPEGRLRPEIRQRSSRLAEPGQLSYRGWSGDVSEFTPDSLDADDEGYFLLGLIGPLDRQWAEDIEATGLRAVDHVHPHGLLVRGQAAGIRDAAEKVTTSEGWPVITFARPLPEDSRVAEGLMPWLTGERGVEEIGLRTYQGAPLVMFVPHGDADVEGLMVQLSGRLSPGPELELRSSGLQFAATAAEVRDLLEQIPEIAFVHGVYPRVPFNNLAAQEHMTNIEPVWNEPTLGYTGAGIITGVNDSGMDLTHPDFPSSAVVATKGVMSAGGNSHGTHVTGTVAGRGTVSSPNNTSGCGDLSTPLPTPRGMAWEALITHDNIFDGGSGTETEMMQWHAQQGALLTNNSWGYGGNYSYLSQSSVIDARVRNADPSSSVQEQMTIVFSAGNDGPTTGTIGAPGNAKNAITVGASQNDRCGSYVPSECSGPDTDSMACFSGRGPAQQRIKPDVIAPGADVLSTGSRQDGNPWDQGWTGPDLQLMPGTSMSGPVVAGAATVFFEFYNDQFGSMPSPALVRGAFINTATDMGLGFPSMDQGWGRINLRKAIEGPEDGEIHYIDQDEVDHLSTGDSWNTTVDVASPDEPLRITLTWIDPPGAAGCNPCHINDLDLIVTAPDGTVYRGNEFDNNWSEPNPSGRDSVNNAENVYVENPAAGQWSIEVTSFNTAQNPPNLDGQDFALVYSGVLGAACDDPATPTGLTASTAASDNAIDLSWDAVTADSYNVYRADTTGGPWNQVASGVETNTHTDSPVTGGDEQFYVVTAFNDPSCESDFSNEDSAIATGFFCSDLDAPTGLTASVATVGQVDLDWDAVAQADSYNIYRADESGGPYDLLESGWGATAYSDGTVESGESYYYVVTAVHADSGCESDQSLEVAIALAPAIEVVPADLVFSIGVDDSESHVVDVGNVGTENLEWSIADDGADVDETLAIPDFSVSGGGAAEVFDIPGGVATRGEVTGFSFQGSVTGVSGETDWASDMKMVMTAPDGSSFDVGGFDNVINDWDFQGDGSADDGTYESDHPGVFDSGDLGDWNFQFTHDWSGGGTMNWSDVTMVLHKTPLAECDSPADIGWLELSPVDGVVTPGDADAVTVTADATGLAEGTYQAEICVLNNDPATPVVVVPIELNVSESTDNPAPVLTSLDPDNAPAGSDDLNLTVNGSGFVVDSIVRWNGADLATSYVSAGALEAVVPESELADAGTADVSVFNPAPGGGTSATLPFEITGQPAVEVTPTSLSAAIPTDQSTDQLLTVSNETGTAELIWDIEQAYPAMLTRTATEFHAPRGGTRDRPYDEIDEPAASSVSPQPQSGYLTGDWSEGFEDIATLPAAGWALQNNSDPDGTTGWFQGDDPPFPAQSGPVTSFIGANFNNTTGSTGTISNWLVTPEIALHEGTELSFWTRVPDGSDWPDRLEVRLSTSGDSIDVGTAATDVGAFDEVLLSINEGLTIGGYPEAWTEFTVTLADLPAGATSGRLAFRYHVTDAGPEGVNSNLIGIDSVSLTQPASSLGCENPDDVPWLSVMPDAGTIDAGESEDLIVGFDSTGLSEATYEALLCVNSNDPVNTVVEVPVTLDVTAPAATQLAFAVQPQSAEVGAIIEPAVTVEVQDASGTVVTTDNSTQVELVLTGGDAGATLSGTTTTTVIDGVATFSDLSIDMAATGYQLDVADLAAELTGDTSDAFDITNVPATVTLDNLVQTYTGDPLGVTVTTDPAGLAVEATYDGATTEPTDAGGYAVVATITEPGYEGSASDTFVIEPAPATLTLFDLGQTWDGDPKPATVTPDPAGVSYSVTYDGSTEAPSEVGEYAVVATITDDNYTGDDANGTLIISEAGSETSIDSISPADSQTVAESYTVTVSVSGNSPTGTVDVEDGTGGSCQVVLPDDSCQMTSTTVGSKTITATYPGDDNHAASSATTAYQIVADEPHQLVFAVQPDDAISLMAVDAVVVHVHDEHGNLVDWDDATEISLGLVGGDPAAELAGGEAITVSGGVASFDALSIDLVGSDYQLETEAAGLESALSVEFEVFHGEPFDLMFVDQPSTTQVNEAITPAVTVAVLDPAGNLADTDNDTEVELTLSGGDAGATLSGITTVTVEEGMATFVDLSVDTAGENYQLDAIDGEAGLGGDSSALFDITNVTATVTLDDLTQTYTGDPLGATVSTDPEGLSYEVTYDGSPTVPIDAGSYAVVATITEPNHEGSASDTFTIEPAPATLELSDLEQSWDGDPKPVTVTPEPAGVSYSVTYDGSTEAPSDVGEYAVVATITEDNYTGDDATGTLIISEAMAEVTLGNLTQTYTGDPLDVTVTTDPAGLAVEVTYDGNTTEPTDAGSYAVVATITEPNYEGSASDTFVIEQAAATLELSNLEQTWDGDPKPVMVTSDPAGVSYSVTYDGSTEAPSDVGEYAVVATITDDNYTGDDANGTLIISEADSETSIDSISPADSQTVGESYGVTVSVTGDNPTGTVAVDDGSGASCQITLPDESCSLTSTSVGARTITAEYSGDDSHGPSADQVSYDITPAEPGLVIVSVDPADWQVAGLPYVVEIAIEGFEPGGTVTVDDGHGESCEIALPATSCELTSTEVGETTLTATYPGDDNNESDQAQMPYEIEPSGPVELMFNAEPVGVVVDEPISPAVIVHVLDSTGEPVENDDDTVVTIELETNPHGAELSGTLSVQVSGGVAVFDDLAIDTIGDGYRLRAADDQDELDATVTDTFEVFEAGIFHDRFEESEQ